MKKHIGILLLCGLIPFLLTACAPSIETENVTKETLITNMVTTTENEKQTVEEFTDDGEKITTFKISAYACKRWFGDTTSEVESFLDSGEDPQIAYDFVSVVNKDTYVELKMSESNIDACRKRMFEYLGVGPSNKLEKDSFFYYNEEYNKMVAYVSEEENIGAYVEIHNIHFCLMTLQMLNGVDSNDWNVDITIINSDTGNVVIEIHGDEKITLTAEDWK